MPDDVRPIQPLEDPAADTSEPPTAAGHLCWTPEQIERRWAHSAEALAAVAQAIPDPRHVVDLGCGTGELTAQAAKLWPTAQITAVDHDDLMSFMAAAGCLSEGHRNVRSVRADVTATPADLGVAAHSVDLVIASFIANNTLTDQAGCSPNGDTDPVGYARWYHEWETREVPLLRTVQHLLAPEGLLVSIEPNNREFSINAWHRLLAHAGFSLDANLSHPLPWECECGCQIPFSLLRRSGGDFPETINPFRTWLKANGQSFHGSTLKLTAEQAGQLRRTAGRPLLELTIFYNSEKYLFRLTELEPFLVYESPEERRLISSTVTNGIIGSFAERLTILRTHKITHRLTGLLAEPVTSTIRGDHRPQSTVE